MGTRGSQRVGRKANYRLLLLILICLGVLLGCPDPYEDMRFRQNGKSVDKVKVKSVDGKGSLKVSGWGFYSQVDDQKFHLVIYGLARYPDLDRDLSLDPLAIRATMNGELLPIEDYRSYPSNKDDKGHLYIRLLCPPCADVFALPDSLALPDADLLLLDFSEVVRMGDKAVFTDTVYAIIPERIKYWARRLHESKR